MVCTLQKKGKRDLSALRLMSLYLLKQPKDLRVQCFASIFVLQRVSANKFAPPL